MPGVPVGALGKCPRRWLSSPHKTGTMSCPPGWLHWRMVAPAIKALGKTVMMSLSLAKRMVCPAYRWPYDMRAGLGLVLMQLPIDQCRIPLRSALSTLILACACRCSWRQEEEEPRQEAFQEDTGPGSWPGRAKLAGSGAGGCSGPHSRAKLLVSSSSAAHHSSAAQVVFCVWLCRTLHMLALWLSLLHAQVLCHSQRDPLPQVYSLAQTHASCWQGGGHLCLAILTSAKQPCRLLSRCRGQIWTSDGQVMIGSKIAELMSLIKPHQVALITS